MSQHYDDKIQTCSEIHVDKNHANSDFNTIIIIIKLKSSLTTYEKSFLLFLKLIRIHIFHFHFHHQLIITLFVVLKDLMPPILSLHEIQITKHLGQCDLFIYYYEVFILIIIIIVYGHIKGIIALLLLLIH